MKISPLYVYNTLTRQKELFKPLRDHQVGIYVCGMTVYDYCHIGHARMMAVFDTIVRYLRHLGYQVIYVNNITDIDDKIIKRANDNHEEYFALAERFIKAMHEDKQALNILPPDQEPRATQYIPQMIELITKLLQKDYAYVAENGDVCYSVSKFKNYGALVQQDLEKLYAGARVDVMDAKKDPFDFVLWKMAKPGEPSWDSPWGKGRPGWHIECSAMAMQLLGEVDIHGGGLDLAFPHHTNEIAQSEAATDKRFVHVWMHNGYVQVNQEKMSKSLGNFFTIRDVLKEYEPEVIRYFLVASHYRSPINYAPDSLSGARMALERFYIALRGLKLPETEQQNNYRERFMEKMNDDFNTPEALAVLFDLVREINRLKEQQDHTQAALLGLTLKKLGSILGVLQQDPEQFLRGQLASEEIDKIKSLIDARNLARQNKNWSEADRLRAELTQLGVELEDTAQSTHWRIKHTI